MDFGQQLKQEADAERERARIRATQQPERIPVHDAEVAEAQRFIKQIMYPHLLQMKLSVEQAKLGVTVTLTPPGDAATWTEIELWDGGRVVVVYEVRADAGAAGAITVLGRGTRHRKNRSPTRFETIFPAGIATPMTEIQSDIASQFAQGQR